jgi:biofilm PGA synthesis N-glycosyltransferase PgaC
MKLKHKHLIAWVYTIAWFLFSLYFAIPWMYEISKYIHIGLACLIVTGMALIPGIAMAFINTSIILDKRPKYIKPTQLPPITIIIAAYNEEKTIINTLNSIMTQEFDNHIDVLVANDGSKDNTKELVVDYIKTNSSKDITIKIIDSPINIGKANVLNLALKNALHEFVITLDADCELHSGALESITKTLHHRSEKYAAVAGSILCKNHDKSYITKLQDWDYLLGISAVKRIQSMYNGTLVAQGAFSIYRKSVLLEVGGWPDKIGEDIVLSWAMLHNHYYIDHSEEAICWTNVPETYKIFYRQRKRWSRGLIEALRCYPGLLFKKEKYVFFIWYNLLFPYIDAMFMFFFVPGIIAPIFGFNLLAGKISLYLLPITFVYSMIIFHTQRKELKRLDISMKNKNINFTLYMLFYQFLMTPATLAGYYSEIFRKKRIWK